MAPASVVLLHSDSDDRDMYSEYLRSHGYAVTVTGSTDDVLPLIAGTDAFLTGLMVPGSIDAVDLIRRVRNEWSSLPIVVVTASGLSDRITQAKNAGADVVLLKPCIPDHLLSALEEVINATAVRLVGQPDRQDSADRRTTD